MKENNMSGVYGRILKVYLKFITPLFYIFLFLVLSFGRAFSIIHVDTPLIPVFVTEIFIILCIPLVLCEYETIIRLPRPFLKAVIALFLFGSFYLLVGILKKNPYAVRDITLSGYLLFLPISFIILRTLKKIKVFTATFIFSDLIGLSVGVSVLFGLFSSTGLGGFLSTVKIMQLGLFYGITCAFLISFYQYIRSRFYKSLAIILLSLNICVAFMISKRALWLAFIILIVFYAFMLRRKFLKLLCFLIPILIFTNGVMFYFGLKYSSLQWAEKISNRAKGSYIFFTNIPLMAEIIMSMPPVKELNASMLPKMSVKEGPSALPLDTKPGTITVPAQPEPVKKTAAVPAQPETVKKDSSFTHVPEGHACKGVDEWPSVQGFAPRRNPAKKEATAVRPRRFTNFKTGNVKVKDLGKAAPAPAQPEPVEKAAPAPAQPEPVEKAAPAPVQPEPVKTAAAAPDQPETVKMSKEAGESCANIIVKTPKETEGTCTANIIWRGRIWKQTIEFGMQSPLLGKGFGVYPAYFMWTGISIPSYNYVDSALTPAHNQFLTVFFKMGILGLGLFLYFNFYAFFYGLSYLRRCNLDFIKSLLLGLLGAFVFWHALAFFFDIIDSPPTSIFLWIIIGAIFAAVEIDKKASVNG